MAKGRSWPQKQGADINGFKDDEVSKTEKLDPISASISAKERSTSALQQTSPANPPHRTVRLRGLLPSFQPLSRIHKAALTTAAFATLIIVTAFLQNVMVEMGSWGYLGAFLINGISSATVVLPAPGAVTVLLMAQDFHPLYLGLAAGLGGALGAPTAYLVGRLGGSAIHPGRAYRATAWIMNRYGLILLLTFGLIPIMPLDFASVVAGTVRYSFWKYFLAAGSATILRTVVLAYIGALIGVEQFSLWLSDIL